MGAEASWTRCRRGMKLFDRIGPDDLRCRRRRWTRSNAISTGADVCPGPRDTSCGHPAGGGSVGGFRGDSSVYIIHGTSSSMQCSFHSLALVCTFLNVYTTDRHSNPISALTSRCTPPTRNSQRHSYSHSPVLRTSFERFPVSITPQ